MIIRKQCRHFYPRSPCGERPPSTLRHCTTYLFLSTLSLRRATGHGHTGHGGVPFLSTLSLRRATVAYHAMCRLSRFLSTLSLRRATEPDPATDRIVSHFYPRSPCGERRAVFNDLRESAGISIHALLAESDQRPSGCRSGGSYFYPRSPCGERPCHAARCCQRKPFLSTLSLRRATSCCSLLFFLWGNFYPRSPCGERRHMYEGYRHTERFLSTLSLRRATPGIQRLVALLRQFLSTLSLRRATSFCRQPPPTRWISIHALLAESDAKRLMQQDLTIKFLSTLSLRRATLAPKQNATEQRNFYPRSPCGERPSDQSIASGQYLFLSTLSLRRATAVSDSV